MASGTNGNGASTNGNGHDEWRDSRLQLSDHCAVVTGGARGIGRATAIALAREGARAIAVVDMSADEVKAFADKANKYFEREVVFPFAGDVTDGEFRRSVFADLESRFGCVSLCVPAAGITRDRLAVRRDKETGALDIYPEELFRRVLDVDLTAPIYWAMQTIASVAKHRESQGLKRWTSAEKIQGVVIFIGSVSSAGNPGQISYATAKAGLEGAEATLGAEAIFHGLRCAIIHPGYTNTAMVRELGEQFIEQAILPNTRLHRLIEPEEIADAICFMIRNAAVSGQLWADAGWRPMA
ncbi:MAG: SDR family oxidoreductase [Phycisphaerales bacterium]|nr:SDR family oxidoreductase [Phycisphaerales bacterium]